MVIINLRELYPFYHEDCLIEVPDEVAQEMRQFKRQEASYQRKRYRHKAYFSLDRNDGIEYSSVFNALTLEELYEQRLAWEQLYAAITKLSNRQGKRIYAHYFLGMSIAAIAREERVTCYAVSLSIQRGLKHMRRLLIEYFS